MSAANPMILTGDSFESADVFNSASATSDRTLGSQMLAMKASENSEELNSHLPPVIEAMGGIGGDFDTSPLHVQSSVLDSVFSTTLEGNDVQDHTPMFDELDLIMDGAKVNLLDDWVALFGDESEETSVPELSLVTHEDINLSELKDFAQPSRKRMFSEVESSTVSSMNVQDQLFTSKTSSSLPTPVLDNETLKPSRSSTKVDHLGCVTYSKKQRSQPLPPVATESTDPILLKRAKNTEAARRSRARKMERMSQLEDKVEKLMGEKSDLELEVNRLREILRAKNISF